MRFKLGCLLLAAFLAAFSLPAAAADYYVNNSGSGSTCSIGSPCDQIADVNALSLSPGDNVYFNCGDTFGDAILNLNDAGTSGNPITIAAGGATTCTGSNKPIIGSTSLARNWDVDTDWIACQDVHFKFASGSGFEWAHVDVTGDNFTADGCDVTGAEASRANHIRGFRFEEVSNATIQNLTIDDTTSGGMVIRGATTCTIDNVAITDWTSADGVTRAGILAADGFTGTCTATDLTMDATGGSPAPGHCLDLKSDASGATWTFDRLTLGECGTDDAFVIQGSTTATFNDLDASSLSLTGDAFVGLIGSSVVDGTPIAVINRGNIVVPDSIDIAFQVAGTPTPDAHLTLNAVTIKVPATASATKVIVCRLAGTCELNNTTVITRNGNTMQRIMQGSTTCTDCTFEIKNSILDSNSTTELLLFTSDPNVTWTLDHNIYENDNAGDWVDDNGTGYNESELISSLDTSGSTTGDPLFVSEDESSGNYLLPDTGSPALGLGDAALLYNGANSTDLFGEFYDPSTPDAGARSTFSGGGEEGSFPSIGVPTETAITSFGTSNSINLPGSIVAGQGLIMLMTGAREGGGSTFNTPSGWAVIYSEVVGALKTSVMFAKVATGSEGATETVTATSPGMAGVSAQVFKVTNWFGSLAGIAVGTLVNVSTNAPDPPGLTAPWGGLDNLWIAVVHSVDDDETVTTYPSGFVGGIDTISGAGVNAGATVATARQENSSSSVNPSAFILNETGGTSANTIVIRPVAAGGVTVGSGLVDSPALSRRRLIRR